MEIKYEALPGLYYFAKKIFLAGWSDGFLLYSGEAGFPRSTDSEFMVSSGYAVLIGGCSIFGVVLRQDGA
jgi:hypothetical protein